MKLNQVIAMKKVAEAGQMDDGGGDALQQQGQEKPPLPGSPQAQKVRGGLFGRLSPVNDQMHKRLTQSGYKHDANFETASGIGRFGYYSHPVSNHQITIDEQGNVQEQQPMGGGMAKGGGGQRGGGGFGGGSQMRRW